MKNDIYFLNGLLENEEYIIPSMEDGNTLFPHKFWRPFLDCMPQLFFRPQYVWFLAHL